MRRVDQEVKGVRVEAEAVSLAEPGTRAIMGHREFRASPVCRLQYLANPELFQ